MSLKDKLNRSQDKDENSPEAQPAQSNPRSTLKDRQKALSDEIARKNRLKNAIEQGEKFYKDASETEKPDAKDSLLFSAKNMFESAWEIDESDPQAREGLIRVLFALATEAKRTHRYKVALDYYHRLASEYQEPNASILADEVERYIEQDKKKHRFQWIGGGIVTIFLAGILLIQSVHLIAWPDDVCEGIGGSILCTPTPTNTPTPAPTSTATPSPTITPTVTLTVTPTITLTPTPTVYQARLNSTDMLVPVYENPTSTSAIKFASNGDFVYLCAKDATSERYLVSLDYCFSPLPPLGWINKRFLVLTFSGDLPAVLTTPSK